MLKKSLSLVVGVMKMNKEYTFSKTKRYLTRGINELVPLAVQILLWDKIDALVASDVTTDYLQVFTFEVTDHVVLTHSQEQPEYKKEYKYPLKDEFKALNHVKIYVIDDITHSTMLLSREY
jgi:hypothetical protein